VAETKTQNAEKPAFVFEQANKTHTTTFEQSSKTNITKSVNAIKLATYASIASNKDQNN